MDGVQLRDEAAQDRVRAATEFLDPSMLEYLILVCIRHLLIENSIRRSQSTKVRG